MSSVETLKEQCKKVYEESGNDWEAVQHYVNHDMSYEDYVLLGSSYDPRFRSSSTPGSYFITDCLVQEWNPDFKPIYPKVETEEEEKLSVLRTLLQEMKSAISTSFDEAKVSDEERYEELYDKCAEVYEKSDNNRDVLVEYIDYTMEFPDFMFFGDKLVPGFLDVDTRYDANDVADALIKKFNQ